jgi:hypothetical protein
VEVAITLGDLRPELARDLHHRLYLRSIHFNVVHPLASRGQRTQIILAPKVLMHLAEYVKRVAQNLIALEFRLRPLRSPLFNLKRIPIPEVVAKPIHCLAKHAFGLALVHFKRTNLVNQIVEHIAHMHGVQHAKSEVDREFQSRLARCRLDPIAVLEQQHSEPIEPGILQCEAILRLIHAKPARSAGPRRKENVVVQNVPSWNAFLLEELQILHQIANRKICRIALPVVAELFADLKRWHIRHRQLLAPIPAALKNRTNQILVLPREPPKQNRNFPALLCRKCAFHRSVEMCGPVKTGNLAQAHALCFQTLLEFHVVFNLDKLRCHTRLLTRTWRCNKL